MISPMLRLALIAFLMSGPGVLILATGIGHVGSCGDLTGFSAFISIWISVFVGTCLLLIAACRAGLRRWKYSRTETRPQLNLH